MSRKVVPFSHRDISSLAKFLRSSLSIIDGNPPKQTEVLNVLARSVGYRSHAAFVSSVKKPVGQSRLVALGIVPGSFREYFLLDDAGQVIDRRHTHPVDQLQFAMSVVIELGHAQAEVVVRAIGHSRGWSFDSDYHPDEQQVGTDTLQEFKKVFVNEHVNLFNVHEVNITLAKAGGSGKGTHQFGKETMIVSENQFGRLSSAVSAVNFETKSCADVMDWMCNQAMGKCAAETSPGALLGFADYLDKVIAVSGEPRMYNWNHEKAAGIRRILSDWARGKRKGERDRRYIYGNLAAFHSPTSWLGRAPTVPDSVRDAMMSLARQG